MHGGEDPFDHIHPNLAIILEGEDNTGGPAVQHVTIPSNIGITSTQLFNPHTHDTTGILHIGESPLVGIDPPGSSPRLVTLKDFFDVWRTTGPNPPGVVSDDIRFDETRILDRFADDEHVVRLYVNGVLNNQFEDYHPLDGDQVVITFEHIAAANAPVLAPIDQQTMLVGQTLQVPLDGLDPEGGPVTYTVSSSNAAVTGTITTGNPSLRLNVSGVDLRGDVFTGDLVFQLYQDLAPATVGRIVALANSGFYDGLTFHRVVNEFVAQGGDPNCSDGDDATVCGNGGSGTEFDDEFIRQLTFTGYGQLAMANSGDDTNDSQIFVTDLDLRLETAAEGVGKRPPQSLNFNHTIFGQLVEGFDVLGKIMLTDVIGETPDDPITINSATVFSDTQNGVLRLSAMGSGFPLISTITVTAMDSEGLTAVRSFPVRVINDTINDRPFLGPLTDLETDEDQAITFTVPTTDLEDDSLTIVLRDPDNFANPPPNLTFTIDDTTKQVTLIPAADFSGTINLLIGVRDDTARATPLSNRLNFDTQQITLTVNPVNDAPIATDQLVTTRLDTPRTVMLSGDDGDPDAEQLLSFRIETLPANGTLHDSFGTPLGPGDALLDPTVTYTPNAGFAGTDSFTFVAIDDGGTENGGVDVSAPGTVTIVVATNLEPTADPQSVTAREAVSQAITLTGDDGEPDFEQALSFRVETLPIHGVLRDSSGIALTTVPVTLPSPDLTYLSEAGFIGRDSFTFVVMDDGGTEHGGQDTSEEATVSIRVVSSHDFFVTTTADSGPGSLRQAILDVNAMPGADFILFDIPTTDDGFVTASESSCDADDNGVPDTSPCWWVISLQSPLPTLTDDTTQVLGSTQRQRLNLDTPDPDDGEITRDTNPGTVGSMAYERPEVAIRGNDFDVFRLDVNALDLLLEGLAIYDADDAVTVQGAAATTQQVGTLRDLLIGSLPDGGDPPDADDDPLPDPEGQRNTGFGIAVSSAAALTVTHSFIGRNGKSGIDVNHASAHVTVTECEVFENGWAPAELNNDGISIRGGSTGNVISNNSIYLNSGEAIDLGRDGITVNDPNDLDSGPNNLQNFPVITDARIASGNLTVEGFADPGARIEFYLPDLSAGFAEGRTFLFARTEGAVDDSDPSTGTYGPNINIISGASCSPLSGFCVNVASGVITSNRFRFTVPAGSVVVGRFINAVATVAGNTSEFGSSFFVHAASGLSGVVWFDVNNNGTRELEDTNGNGRLDAGEDTNGNGVLDHEPRGLPGVKVRISGRDSSGNPIVLDPRVAEQETDSSGAYNFMNLTPGTYTVREEQPPVPDGRDRCGSLGGTSGNDQCSAIVLTSAAAATDYNFGELVPTCTGFTQLILFDSPRQRLDCTFVSTATFDPGAILGMAFAGAPAIRDGTTSLVFDPDELPLAKGTATLRTNLAETQLQIQAQRLRELAGTTLDVRLGGETVASLVVSARGKAKLKVTLDRASTGPVELLTREGRVVATAVFPPERPCQRQCDLNRDGIDDRIFQFNASATTLAPGDPVASMLLLIQTGEDEADQVLVTVSLPVAVRSMEQYRQCLAAAHRSAIPSLTLRNCLGV
jgi:cyclophilin family peptidyl-prolyl cis-trans isomerase